MSISVQGLGVSPGIVIGKAHMFERDQLDISEYSIEPHDVVEEVHRFENALTLAREQLRNICDRIPRNTPSTIAAFIDTHLLLIESPALTQETVRLISERRCNAEWALKLQHDAVVTAFEEADEPYVRTRKNDVDHVVYRIQRILLKQAPLRHEMPDSHLQDHVIVAKDLTPADIVLLQKHGVGALATEHGGLTSYTAILARSLGIPGVVGVHHTRKHIREDDLLIVDGAKGVVIVNPDEDMLAYYRELQLEEKAHLAELIKLRGIAPVTRDGFAISLQANIELPRDFEEVLGVGAAGVGLYRTEFLYMNRDEPPDEDEHFETYCQMLRTLDNIPITIRTFDLGADKQADGGAIRDGPLAANPALGLRAVRLGLKDRSMFRPQLRAIIRASALGPVRLLIPMLSNLQELYQVLQMVEEIRAEFRATSIKFDSRMPIGGMIEVPAAAICADIFAQYLDFLSIGTNDLIQYTVAVDRYNDEVSYLYDALHPGVLKLIHRTIEAGKKAGKPVAVCGEMAGDTRYVRLLLGLGLREFSVYPAVLLEIKRIINSTALMEVEPLAAAILDSDSAGDTQALLERINTGVA